MAVSFIGGEIWSTRRKPPTCPKSLTNFSIYLTVVHIIGWLKRNERLLDVTLHGILLDV
jgi:hypothetical protein